MSTKLNRPPVITVLGHVDHGKTSILDRIRKTNLAAREAGGITQAIGAYQIEFGGKPLTFIDTPGHAAFSAMRARGGQVADLAILVVAADDGVMPQTIESIEHIKKADIPFVVAINKVDLPGVDLLKVKQGLAENGVYVEGYGGNVPAVEISAKTGAGFDRLLETITLLAELEDLPDTTVHPAQAVIIESQLHFQKGPLTTLLIQAGTLKLKDDLYVGAEKVGKVRSLLTAAGTSVNEALPATPVQVLGFTLAPPVGEIVTTTAGKAVSPAAPSSAPAVTGEKKLPIILRADVAGSLEALLGSLPPSVQVLSAAVGAPTESDVALAASNHAQIICFNLKVGSNVAKLAQVEGVPISVFRIIYELFDYLTQAVAATAEAAAPGPTGQAQVLKLFTFDKKTVYGCLVTAGKIKLGDHVAESIVTSLRVGKDSVKEAKKDEQCGLILEPAASLKPGDIIEARNGT